MFKKVWDARLGRIQEPEKCNHTFASECQCDCHKKQFKKDHLIPCCQHCSLCNKNIKLADWAAWKTFRTF